MNRLRKCGKYNGIYSTTKNDILSFAGKWIKLEHIILSEVSSVQRAEGCIFSLISAK
jgi:hypothetical protein